VADSVRTDSPSTTIDAALAYVRGGMRAVLLHEVMQDGNCSCGNRNGTCPAPNGKDSTGKHPRETSWLKNPITDEAGVMKTFGRFPTANIGLCPKDDEIVLDIDPRNGGSETFSKLVHELGEPAGPCALTGGGGHHYWLKLPPGVDVSTATRLINAKLKLIGPGIDLRTSSNQVVVPPSLHKSGRRYQWVKGRSVIECETTVPSNAWLVALGLRERSEETSKPGNARQHEENDLARAEWGLLHERLLHPDRGYHDWFRLGPALKGLGDDGLRLWIEASRPSKDFDEDEIRRKWPGIGGSSINALFGMFDDADPTWRDRYRDQHIQHGTPGIGADKVESSTAGSPQPPELSPSAITRLWRPLRSLSIPPTPRRWLLRHPTRDGQPAAPGAGDGLLLRGKAGQLVSAGGTGKTVALIQLAVACIVGRPWLDHFQPDDCKGRILLALAEEDEDEVHRRMHDACRAMRLSAAELRLVEDQCTTLALSGEAAALLSNVKGSFAETREMRDLRQRLHDEAGEDGWAGLMLDPLARWGGINTDVDASAGTRSVQAFESLTRVPGNPAVLVAQHSSKLARRTGAVDSRGSTALTDGFRWEGSLLAKDGFVYFKQEKSNYSRPMEGQGIPLRRGEGGILHVAALADQSSMDDDATEIRLRFEADVEQVVNGMAEFGHTASSIDQVCSIAGIGKTAGRVAVRQALSLGRLIDRTPKGKSRAFALPGALPSTPDEEGGEDPHTPAAGAGVQTPTATADAERPRASKRRPRGAGVQDIDDGLPEKPRSRRKAKAGGGA